MRIIVANYEMSRDFYKDACMHLVLPLPVCRSPVRPDNARRTPELPVVLEHIAWYAYVCNCSHRRITCHIT